MSNVSIGQSNESGSERMGEKESERESERNDIYLFLCRIWKQTEALHGFMFHFFFLTSFCPTIISMSDRFHYISSDLYMPSDTY